MDKTQKVVFYNNRCGVLEVDICALSDWDGFDRLIRFLKKEYSVEVLQNLDAPDLRGYRHWILKAGDQVFELIYDDFWRDSWGSSIVAPTSDSQNIVRTIGLDLERRLETDSLV